MKQFVCWVFLMCCLFPSTILAETSIPDYCMPILEAWGAKDGKELQLSILEHWKSLAPKSWERVYTPRKRPISFQMGGTTKELVANHKKWDVAIVSSKNVDLQKLADEGVILSMSHCPTDLLPLHQWLLPKEVQKKLPAHPLFVYAIYCYDYNPQTDEAIFLIANDKHRPVCSREGWMLQIQKGRSADQIRTVESISLANEWVQEGIPEWTEAELLKRTEEWDWAILRIDPNDKLEMLDREGILFDFSQDIYWADRNPAWAEPNGLFSSDGRMIAVPYDPIITGRNPPDKISVFVVNAKSEYLLRALEYAKHFVKSYEWLYSVIQSGWQNPDIIERYGESSICIFKDDMDW